MKLAVICLATLAATLAFGTKFNSDYGMNAANEYIYQTRGFALLMAFLGLNVLCAALIRYPWTKRQTGFVITHVGLLIVIGGSWWAAQTADEGMVGMREGERSSKLVRNHKPVLYVKPIDPHSGQSQGEYTLPFRPGAFDWEPGRFEVVSGEKDPFKLAIKRYYSASAPRTLYEADPSGTPMIKLRPKVIPPGGKEPVDVFTSDEDRWFATRPEGVPRVFRRAGPAQFIFSFVDRPELLDDFANPPADPGKEGVARLIYTDKSGKIRTVEVKLDDAKPGQVIPLPESDLTATFSKVDHESIESPRIRRSLGEEMIHIVQFLVKKGDGPEIKHNGYAGLPMAPTTVPDSEEAGAQPPPALLHVSYFYPPIVDPQVNQRYGQIEIMGDNQGRVAYRVFERGNPAKVRVAGLIKPGEEVTAFGGNSVSPMTMTFSVEEFLQAGVEKEIFESIDMPPNKKDDGLAAVLAEMTVNGVTKDVWLQKSPTFDPSYRTVTFPDSMYEVAFDVDHMDLGFSLKLNDFDVGFDPGTSTASSYRSEVTLSDEAAGIKEKPVSIYMNHTLDHKGWRFFQTSYSRYRDPKTGQETGEFVSVFQVAKNPAREMIYAGCIIVVLGAFVQFYMRAGIFTDGGHRQRERAAEKARKRLAAKSGQADLVSVEPPIEDAEPL
ncbi:cytochrome c biogenesis protein ResB [Tundrisphaera lichenicola]|uniref:cytochrome c biogenesis protein ResB n=1 Tax=Tundrisphaera lichenicola TaxID=2029860 RepID=UPI003EB8AA2F